MPKALEQKLKKEYGANSDIPYKIMNKMGVMHGNKETAKGKHMDVAKDDKWQSNPFAKKYKAKNEARTKALSDKDDSRSATEARNSIPKKMHRKIAARGY